jgi:hypothetical protein
VVTRSQEPLLTPGTSSDGFDGRRDWIDARQVLASLSSPLRLIVVIDNLVTSLTSPISVSESSENII